MAGRAVQGAALEGQEAGTGSLDSPSGRRRVGKPGVRCWLGGLQRAGRVQRSRAGPIFTGNEDLLSKAAALAKAIDAQWVDARRTWSDVCLAGPHDTSAVRTLDALFAVLVSENPRYVDAAFAEIFDPRLLAALRAVRARPPMNPPMTRPATGEATRGPRRSIC